MAEPARLEHLKRQLRAREGNPAMARSIALIRKQIAAIEEAQEKAKEEADV